MGVSRHVVVADTDEQAKELARPAYRKWRRAMAYLWERSGVEFPLAKFLPATWDAAEKGGHVIAGNPETVRAFVQKEVETGGVNYFVSGFAFGNLSVDQVTSSAELFSREVMPAFAD
jgi:alkanesulfonate monooxygenase SsuD/methylene tetrahydromethanopterin reductase-like flavin-dependent oxidoreductase (luciferase family)